MARLAVRARAFLVVVMIMASMGGTARAVTVGITPANEIPKAAPAMITAYQTSNFATSLLALEVFNDSSQPLDLSQWKVRVITKDEKRVDITARTSFSGFLLPNEHITYASGGNTTYALEKVILPSAITTIEYVYMPDETAYRTPSIAVKDLSDQAFFRTYTSTGYSTASFPYAVTPARHFYDDGLYKSPSALNGLRIVEVYPYASDCTPFDTSVLCGDYVKIENTSDIMISLDDLALRTDSSSASRTASNTIILTGTLAPHAFTVVAHTDDGDTLSLTNSGGYVWLEDAWGLVRYDATLTKYEPAGSDEQGYGYAVDSSGTWQWTTTPQPASANRITARPALVAECPAGKYRSPETGRCRTIEEAVNALTACEEGSERNPITNRCRKVVVAAAKSTLTPCLEGQERNPATNRCRSIASAVAELMPCDEGYERNPSTNRCRKITGGSVPAAEYPVATIKSDASTIAGWWALGGVSAVALGYAVYEWRREIIAGVRKLAGRLRGV